MTSPTSQSYLFNADVPTENQSNVVDILKVLLSSEYILFFKTRNYHWNIIGPTFYQLHLLFQEQYTKIDELAHRIAERIRQYGFASPGSCGEFNKLSILPESGGDLINAQDSISDLLNDHEHILDFINNIPNGLLDRVTETLIGDVEEFHYKQAWFLRSLLE